MPTIAAALTESSESMRIALLGLSLTCVAAGLRAQESDEEFRWETDLEAARQQAAEQHKPMLVVFRCET